MKLVKPSFSLNRTDNNELSFHDSIKYVINMHFFYGIDIRKKQNYHFVCNFLFSIHLIFGMLFLCHAVLKAELQSDDTQVFVWSLGFLTTAILNGILKIIYRWSARRLTDLVNRSETKLEFFPAKEKQSHLNRINRISKCGVVLPGLFLIIQIARQIEVYCFSKNTVSYGSATFRKLQEKYYIDDIFRIVIALPCFIFFLQGTLLCIPLYVNNSFVFKKLNKITDIVLYIKIHQHFRAGCKVSQKALGPYFFFNCGTILVVILFFARTVATSSHNISISALILLSVYLPILIVHVVYIGKLNAMLDSTFGHLQNPENWMKMNDKILGPKERTNLLEKIELYVMHVNFDDPYAKLIGVGRVKPKIAVGILGFLVNYICLLYDK
ncbi:hypothetical protein CHUAL_014264 [Chamberlinius hualienensis]